MDNDQLTRYQRLLIEQFYSITSCSNRSESEVVELLASNDWNLEIAIIEYYQQNPSSHRDFISTYTESVQMSRNNSSRSIMSRLNSAFNNTSSPLLPGLFPTDNENPPSKLHQIFNRLIYYLVLTVQFVLVLPLMVFFKVIGLLLVVVIDKIMPVLSKVFGLRLASNTYYARKNLTNPVERSRRFIYTFDEFINNRPLIDINPAQGAEEGIKESDSSLMEINRPNFLECSYTNALYLLKKDFKWLMIYLQSDEHEDKAQFIQQVLLNDQLLGFLKNNEILFWGGNMKESESYQIANSFNVSGFPFLGLITMTTEQSNTTPQVSLVSKIQGVGSNYLKSDGSINTSKIISKFHKTFERLNPTLVSLRTDAQQRELSRNIRAQQDLAYQRSLEQDRRREQARQRALEAERAEELRQQQEELMKKQRLQYLYNFLQDFQTKESQYDLSDRKQVSRIAIRLPSGYRVQHNFHKEFTIEDLYLYAECLMEQIPDITAPGVQLPENYNHIFNFKLISVMPREQLPLTSEIIGENKLVYPSGNLAIEQE